MKITNTTTLKELLDKAPQLEATLSAWLPAIRDLEQDTLKERALAVTSLEHLARVTDREVGALIEEARQAAGQEDETSSGQRPRLHPDDPDWVRGPLAQRVDGTRLLSKGMHPLSEVKAHLSIMDPGEVLLLTTDFHPRPMLTAMRALGLEAHSRQDLEDEDRHLTFIKK